MQKDLLKPFKIVQCIYICTQDKVKPKFLDSNSAKLQLVCSGASTVDLYNKYMALSMVSAPLKRSSVTRQSYLRKPFDPQGPKTVLGPFSYTKSVFIS